MNYGYRINYNTNYVALPSQKKTRKHTKGYDLEDKSRLYTTYELAHKKDAKTRYITYNKKHTPVKQILANVRYQRHQGKNIKVLDNGDYIIVYENNEITTYKVYYRNKLDNYKKDYSQAKKIYNF